MEILRVNTSDYELLKRAIQQAKREFRLLDFRAGYRARRAEGKSPRRAIWETLDVIMDI